MIGRSLFTPLLLVFLAVVWLTSCTSLKSGVELHCVNCPKDGKTAQDGRKKTGVGKEKINPQKYDRWHRYSTYSKCFIKEGHQHCSFYACEHYNEMKGGNLPILLHKRESKDSTYYYYITKCGTTSLEGRSGLDHGLNSQTLLEGS